MTNEGRNVAACSKRHASLILVAACLAMAGVVPPALGDEVLASLTPGAAPRDIGPHEAPELDDEPSALELYVLGDLGTLLGARAEPTPAYQEMLDRAARDSRLSPVSTVYMSEREQAGQPAVTRTLTRDRESTVSRQQE